VKKSAWLSLAWMLALLVAPAAPQTRNNFPKPPEALDPRATEKVPASSSKHIDLANCRGKRTIWPARHKPFRPT
jgi:hypothetical protein